MLGGWPHRRATYSQVMAEPISAMRRLLSEEFELSVVSRGTADYCGFHRASEDQDVRKDQGSAVREVYDRFRWKELKQTKSHRDALARPDLFLAAFREALDQEPLAPMSGCSLEEQSHVLARSGAVGVSMGWSHLGARSEEVTLSVLPV